MPKQRGRQTAFLRPCNMLFLMAVNACGRHWFSVRRGWRVAMMVMQLPPKARFAPPRRLNVFMPIHWFMMICLPWMTLICAVESQAVTRFLAMQPRFWQAMHCKQWRLRFWQARPRMMMRLFAFALWRNWPARPAVLAWRVGRCLILKPKPALLILLKPAKCK